MKKAFLLIAMLFCAAGITHAQDRITTKDGVDIQAKILEVGSSDIKYKKFSNLEGPTYTISKEDILIITYANGENEVFKDTAPKRQTPQKPSDSVNSKQAWQQRPGMRQQPQRNPYRGPKQVREPKPKKVYEQRKFVVGTGTVEHCFGEDGDDMTTMDFGARFGIMKLFGFYIGAEVGIGGFPFYDYERIDWSELDTGKAILVKRQDPRLNLAFGGLLRLNKASTLYLGSGWTFGQTLFCGQNGTWYDREDGLSSPIIEAGAYFHIKKFTIMIGGSFISDEWVDNYNCYGKISFGVGYNF